VSATGRLTRRRAPRKAAAAPPAGQLALEHRAKGGAAAEARPADGKHELMPLDATVVDVYAGAHAVIFMIGACYICAALAELCAPDPSKPWTLEYVTRELALCPPALPVAVLLSFRDRAAELRCVRREAAEAALCARDGAFGQRLYRPQVLEASMCNAFGLRALHAFLALPFLAHKRAELARQLEANGEALAAARARLEEAAAPSYEDFAEALEATARAEAEAAAAAAAAVAAAAAAAAEAEAEKWRWLTGDARPGGAPPPPPAAAAAPSSVASLLGSLGLGALVGVGAPAAPPPPPTLDGFLGAPAGGAAGAEAEAAGMSGFLGEEAEARDGGGGRARARRADLRGWDSSSGEEAEAAAPPAVPSLRPAAQADARALVLSSPGSGGSGGGREVQRASFGQAPAAAARAPAPRSPRAASSAVQLGGRGRADWDDSDSSD